MLDFVPRDDDSKHNGVQIKCPPGSIVENVSRVMETPELNVVDAAKRAGMRTSTYAFVRDLILLRGRKLEPEDAEKIERALASLETSRSCQEARSLTLDIFERLLRRRSSLSSEDKIKKKRHSLRRFEDTMTQIVESCDSTKGMEIPRLTAEEILRHCADLAISIELISRLQRKMIGIRDSEEGEES